MATQAELLAFSIPIGVGATAIMDLWGAFQKRVLGVRPLDYALVGRWLGQMAQRRARHQTIATSPPIPGEQLIGWAAHYAIGVVFAAGLLTIRGEEWTRDPSLTPALIAALATIVFPFFVLQPALGAGIAASRTPQPNIARARTVVTHLVFGTGLYVSARLLSTVMDIL
jgi:hypothetical protein